MQRWGYDEYISIQDRDLESQQSPGFFTPDMLWWENTHNNPQCGDDGTAMIIPCAVAMKILASDDEEPSSPHENVMDAAPTIIISQPPQKGNEGHALLNVPVEESSDARRRIRRQRKSANHSKVHPLKKTEMCENWLAGRCPYGKKCMFAHGVKDLRTLPPHMRRRKKIDVPCKHFSQRGTCPYGRRCVFVHRKKKKRISDTDGGGSASRSPQKPICLVAINDP